MRSWPTVSLAEISAKPQYGAIAKGREHPPGPLFVRQTDITGGRIDWETVPFCDLDADSAERYQLRRGDLLISRLGNGVGNAATVTEDRADAVFAGYLVRFQPDQEEADARFVGYQLQSKRWRDHVTSFRSGAAQPTLNAQQMGDFEFSLPPIAEQRAIAATLGSLDDKIESNRRAVGKAQELGDAMFISAVDEHRVVSEIATITMGTSPKGDTLNEVGDGVDFYQGTRDFGFRFPSRRIWTTNPIRLARRNDTLMSVRAPVGELNRALRDCCVGRGVAAIHSEKQPSTLYYAMRASRAAWDKFQGDGTVFASVNKQDVHGTEIHWIADRYAEDLEQVLSSLDSKIESLEMEKGRLTSLRDTLLPALLSGSIRVPVEGVAA